MNILNRLKLSIKILLNPNPLRMISSDFKLRPRKYTEYIPSEVLNNNLLAGKNILITGAGQNIGEAIAIEMAKQGANIYFTDIEKSKCEILEEDLKKFEIKTKGFLSDISVAEDIESLIDHLQKENIDIDVLVNNAAVQFDKKGIGISEFNFQEWEKTYYTNVFGPVYLTKKISERMALKGIHGNIIFITSIHQEYIGMWGSYSSSKASLAMMVKELAYELSEQNIRVNGIAPGWVKLDEYGNTINHNFNMLHNSTIEPAYIGRAAIYLASEYFSKYTTGTILKIDSGHTLVNIAKLDL